MPNYALAATDGSKGLYREVGELCSIQSLGVGFAGQGQGSTRARLHLGARFGLSAPAVVPWQSCTNVQHKALLLLSRTSLDEERERELAACQSKRQLGRDRHLRSEPVAVELLGADDHRVPNLHRGLETRRDRGY